jgi:uncharacterized protein (TIGR02246 family)
MYILPTILWILGTFIPAPFWAPMTTASTAAVVQNDPSLIEGANVYLKAVLAGDVPAITAMFQDDAILMPPNQPMLHGRVAIEHFYERLCHGPAKLTAFTFEHLESRTADDAAFDVGTYKQTLVVGPGQRTEDNGKYSVILKRTRGDWKIAYLIFNSDLQPMPTATKVGK